MSYQEQTTAGQGTGEDHSLRTHNIFETAGNMPEISRFVEAIRTADLEYRLRAPDPTTLFAPTNNALEASSEWRKLSRDADRLKDLIGKHIVHGSQTEADLRTASELKTFSGTTMPVRFEEDGALYGGAKIIHHDIPCINGHIQVIDRLAEEG